MPSSQVHRRSPAAAAVLLMLLGAALTACGFDAPTDRVNTIAAGANNRDAAVDALGFRVLSSRAGEGRLIGALANNTAEEAGLEAVAGEGITVEGLDEPITLPPAGRLNLAAEDAPAVLLTGEFIAGQEITLDVTLAGETLTFDVPVVKRCGQYTAVPEPESGGDNEEAEGEGHAEDEHDATYLCDHPTDDAGH